MTPPVLLLHGIWMRGFTLALLARRLRARGHAVACLDYASVAGAPARALDRIARRLEGLADGGPVHLVGHSLGGLLAVQAACRDALPAGSRVLCLGTPLAGSAVARALAGRRSLRWSLGGARDLLCRGAEALPGQVPVAMVAGSLPLGFGALVPGLSGPHDGTVAVAETRHPGLAGHAVLRTSHSGLLLSAQAAGLAASWLAGQGLPAAPPDGLASGLG
ncbi:MAG: alpha/beta fold hydrolase [Pseudoxanthomonas sp.]|nr:alpha/beta fold hydrolase [Pseudoxanthomonas sp.]